MEKLYVYLKNGETVILTNLENTNVVDDFFYAQTKEKGQIHQYSFNLSEVIYIHTVNKRIKKEI